MSNTITIFRPAFDNYVIPGDFIIINEGNFTYTISLEPDYETNPYDYDYECYEKKDIDRWLNDEWFYGGLVVSAEYKCTPLASNLASLWGIECNFSENDNSYLTDVAYELLEEARDEARKTLDEIRERLCA